MCIRIFWFCIIILVILVILVSWSMCAIRNLWLFYFLLSFPCIQTSEYQTDAYICLIKIKHKHNNFMAFECVLKFIDIIQNTCTHFKIPLDKCGIFICVNRTTATCSHIKADKWLENGIYSTIKYLEVVNIVISFESDVNYIKYMVL